MKRGVHLASTRSHPTRLGNKTLGLLIILLLWPPGQQLKAQRGSDDIDDITGKYSFLSADDTLAILEEEGKLKGYVDIYQSEEESDAILSYPITIGSRSKDRVEFKTGKIHQKYYRFAGTAGRGSGHEPTDPDYLRLIGDLEIIQAKGDRGEEAVERRRVVFKSKGKSEGAEDEEQ